jgi:hypothetical protein
VNDSCKAKSLPCWHAWQVLKRNVYGSHAHIRQV